jgi:UDP-glucuronate decarboxylase
VTGGAGFLGSHLCERLVSEGNRVTCLDNLQTGSLKNVEHLKRTGHFTFVLQEVAQPFHAAFDEIYNLACAASPPAYQKDPIHTMKTCVIGAINVLELARMTGARIFQASTSEVYGTPLVHPQPETYWGNVNPAGVRSCYDEGKRAAEALFFDYNRMHGVDVRVGRIFNTYGPKMDPKDGRVVSNFITQALAGKDITIYGDGSQTRSFCYVDDLVEVIVRMMRHDSPITQPINIGNPGEFTVRELAEMVLMLTGSGAKIVTRPLPQDDPTQRRPDITRASELLDWRPSVPLIDGLKKTIAYFAKV